MTSEQLGERPSPRPRADLKSAFAPPNRASSLGGRLSRVPMPPTPATQGPDNTPAAVQPPAEVAVTTIQEEDSIPPAVSPPAPTASDAEEAAPSATSPGEGRSRQKKSTAVARNSKKGGDRRQAAEGGTATTIVYLPGEILERLRQERLRTGATYTELVLDALDATHTRLAQLLEAMDRPQARPAGSLFAGASHSRLVAAQPKAQITLRPRVSDAEVIDALARDHDTNRSKLVSVALDAHLKDA